MQRNCNCHPELEPDKARRHVFSNSGAAKEIKERTQLPAYKQCLEKKSISEQQYALQFAILKRGKIDFSVTKVVDQRLSISGAVTVSMCAEVKQITAINPTSL